MAAEAVDRSSAISGVLGDGKLFPDIGSLALASHHRLELLLFNSLLQGERISTRTRAAAVAALERAGRDNTRLFDELQSVISILTDAGIPTLPLKGPALALLLWNDLRLRRCRDIDILVPQASVAEAVRLLETVGYSSPPLPGGLLRELELTHRDKGVALDLHWNITHGEMAFPLDFNALWSERYAVTYNGAIIPMMSPEWLFIVTSIYLAKSYPWPEVVYLSDLARLTLRFPHMDWERVHGIATQTGTRRICAVGLALIDSLPGSAVHVRARALFPADAMVRAAARRMRRAAEYSPTPDAAGDEYSGPSRRLRRILSHVAFRERPADKAWAYLSLLPLLLMPGRASEGWAQASFARLGRLADAAAAGLGESLWPASWASFGGTTPAPGPQFFALDDAGILLSGARQELFALSPSAAFLWCGLHEGIPRRTIERKLSAQTGQTPTEARAEVTKTLREWRAAGLLGRAQPPSCRAAARAAPRQAVPDGPPLAAPAADAGSRPQQRRRYQLLNTVLEIGLPSSGLAEAFDSALGHLAVTKEPDFNLSVIHGASEFLIIAGRRVIDHCSDEAAVVPTVKSAICTEVINREDFGLYVHAAMLRDAADAMLLPAPPQSGKTCLAAALARAGLTYCTDETTLLDPRTFDARGLRTALTVKTGAWQLLQPLYPELQALPAHRRCDGKIVKYLRPPGSTVGADAGAPCRVSSIVFPRYVAGGTTALTTVPRLEALRHLMDECVAMRLTLAPAEVKSLVNWMDSVSCHALAYGDLSAAVDLLLDLSSSTTRWSAAHSSIRVVA